MQSLIAILFSILSTIAAPAEAEHHHHTHRRLPSIPDSSGSLPPFPFVFGLHKSLFPSSSGTPQIAQNSPSVTASYPIVHNRTTEFGTGIGRSASIGTTTLYSTRVITVEDTSLSLALGNRPSIQKYPIHTETAEKSDDIGSTSQSNSTSTFAPFKAISTPFGDPASLSQALSGFAGSNCPVPTTVTVTQDTTVTITSMGSDSAPTGSDAPDKSQQSLSDTADINMATDSPSGTQFLGKLSFNQGPVVTSLISVQQLSDDRAENPTSSIVPFGIEATAANYFSTPASSVAAHAYQTPLPTQAPSPNTDSSLVISAEGRTTAIFPLVSIASHTMTVAASATVSVTQVPPISSTSRSSSSLSPNGIKAGVAGYRSITGMADWDKITPYIGWYSDYFPDTPDSGKVAGIPMVSAVAYMFHVTLI